MDWKLRYSRAEEEEEEKSVNAFTRTACPKILSHRSPALKIIWIASVAFIFSPYGKTRLTRLPPPLLQPFSIHLGLASGNVTWPAPDLRLRVRARNRETILLILPSRTVAFLPWFFSVVVTLHVLVRNRIESNWTEPACTNALSRNTLRI